MVITMKNMNLKTVLPVCVLLLAAVLGGCGRAPSIESTEGMQKATNKGSSYETAQSESKEALKGNALLAYQEILNAAPALEGDHAELADASFDYDQNLRLFGKHYELFALFDINQDEIPELIALSTVNFRWTPLSVYTYADGEAVLLKERSDTEAHATFEQRSTANGAYITYLCEENHIHSVWRGTTPVGEAEENSAYALDGTTLTAVDCTAGETENTIYFHDIAKENTPENIAALTR